MSDKTSSPSTESPPKTGVAALDELFQPVNRSDAPGLVVGVAQQGRTVYRRGFGLASVELGVANTPWTRMRIGSTSKHFTCLAVLLLAEEGKLDVDASVRRYIPELPLLDGEPTLRQLMNHTSGYRCYLDTGFLAHGMAIQPAGLALQMQVRQAGSNFRPGDNMIYCNSGYHLLSVVIERISGQPFEQFLQERIFTPMAMLDTRSVPSDFEIHRGMATLHVAQADGSWRRGIFPTEEVRGEGAMISTVDDMLAWLAHMRRPTKTVGSEETWRQMLVLTTLNNGQVNPYALGLMRHDYRGVEVVHHAGGVIGGSCQMITVPSQALDIVIITNGALVNAVELAYKVIDALAADALTAPAPAKAAAEQFRPMVGSRYHSPASGLAFGFEEAPERRLGLSFLNGPPVPLREMQGSTVLGLAFQDMAMGPLTVQAADLAGEGGEVPSVLALAEAGHIERYERLPATAPSGAEAGAALIGRYRAADLAADAEVSLDGDKLQLVVFGAAAPNLMLLQPWSSEVFAVSVAGTNLPLRGVVSVERDSSGHIAAFRINTGRTRHMRFVRLAD